jgi:hypothetical protein
VSQAEFQFSPVENGGLFSENFLEHRLPQWPEYGGPDAGELLEKIQAIWEREGPALPSANEAQVEEHFIQPVLELLGQVWTPQAGYSTPSGRSVPDYALFLSEESRLRAAGLRRNSLDRFGDAVALVEAKEFERPFDTRRGGTLSEDPHAQILRYLNETRVPWGILTNGRSWRLYSYERATQGSFYGVDLVALLEQGDPEEFRRFAVLFSRSALEPDEQGLCLLDRMLREAERNAVAVGDALERQVFEAVPLLATGLLGEEERSDANLALAFENSLVFLYRMLFCLHAEARELLPVNNPHYEPQSLLQIRRDVAAQRDAGGSYSERSDRLYSMLRALFRIVDEGEPAFDVNAYNGGLFSPTTHRYFEGRTIPDPQLAPAIDLLSRVGKAFVDFRELSVRHLGTVYEKLLAYQLAEEGGTLALRQSSLKHRSGSYFTPERVVDSIVARTLEPVLLEVAGEIAERGIEGRKALRRFLDLKICDPAAGSGHFLVGAVEYVAQFIATDPSYEQSGARLPELPEIRRLVAEQCIYGVDINPMAIELARLSLWLATVDGEQPLTFLENLRVGNSIVGTSVEDLLRGGDSVFTAALARDAEKLLESRAEIAARPSSTAAEVHEKEEIADAADALREPIEEFADETLGIPLEDPEIGDPFHWDIEFPEVFLTPMGAPKAEGGFDAVIGNPPYIQIQSLGRATAEFCRERYRVAAGAFDAYVVFLERTLELMGPRARLGFILPNKFTKLEMARGLRKLLVERRAVEEILDFGGAQLFGAVNYTAVLLLDASGDRGALRYRKLSQPDGGDPIAEIETMEPSEFAFTDLDEGPWILAAPSERRVMEAASAGAEPLADVTEQIFQGLITSADSVFHFEDLGAAGPLRRVRSKASGQVIELEPDLLHPLASGGEVRPYAFATLRTLLLFPYGGEDGMQLLDWKAMETLPRTAAYLLAHAEELRGRERGKMDHERWYGYVYPKNLSAHERPKLGIPRLCERLRASADPSGGTYLDNVDVNGVLPREGGPTLWQLLLLLNSRLLNFLFELRTVPFRGNYMSANKQFVAPLPIAPLDGVEAEMDELGMRLHATAAAIEAEKTSFLDWAAGEIGADPRSLPGKTKLVAYEDQQAGELLRLLAKSRQRLRVDPGTRVFHESFEREHGASSEKLNELRRKLELGAAEADRLVFDAYGISAADRQLVTAR